MDDHAAGYPQRWRDPQLMQETISELIAVGVVDNPDVSAAVFAFIAEGWSYLDSSDLLGEFCGSLFSRWVGQSEFAARVQEMVVRKRDSHYRLPRFRVSE